MLPWVSSPLNSAFPRSTVLHAAAAICGLALLAVLAAFLPALVRPQGAANYAMNGFPAPGAAPSITSAGATKNVPRNALPPQSGAADAAATPAHLQDTSATTPAQKAEFGSRGGRAADRRENHSCRGWRRARGSHYRCGCGAERGPPGGARPSANRTIPAMAQSRVSGRTARDRPRFMPAPPPCPPAD